MRFLKQCLQAVLSFPLSLPDPTRRLPAFSIVHTDTLTESLEQATRLSALHANKKS